MKSFLNICKNKNINTYYFLGLLAFLFFSISILLPRPTSKLRSEYLPPPVEIKRISVGMRPALADVFWLRAVQDFDYCDQKTNERECHGKSWLFNVLNLVFELDAKVPFPMYQIAGLALTVIISDYAGASVIFDRGVQQYPKAWPLTYAAGYHALYEEKDNIKASRLYLSTAENGGPIWLYSLASRLSVDGGDREFSEKILAGLLESSGMNAESSEVIERIRTKLQQK